jgi:hypothetical protein
VEVKRDFYCTECLKIFEADETISYCVFCGGVETLKLYNSNNLKAYWDDWVEKKPIARYNRAYFQELARKWGLVKKREGEE